MITKSTLSYRYTGLICPTTFNSRSCTSFPTRKFLVTVAAKIHRGCQLRTNYKINYKMSLRSLRTSGHVTLCFYRQLPWTDSAARYGRVDGPARGDLISTSGPRGFDATNYRAVYLCVSGYLVQPLDACSFVHCGRTRRYGGKIHGPRTVHEGR